MSTKNRLIRHEIEKKREIAGIFRANERYTLGAIVFGGGSCVKFLVYGTGSS